MHRIGSSSSIYFLFVKLIVCKYFSFSRARGKNSAPTGFEQENSYSTYCCFKSPWWNFAISVLFLCLQTQKLEELHCKKPKEYIFFMTKVSFTCYFLENQLLFSIDLRGNIGILNRIQIQTGFNGFFYAISFFALFCSFSKHKLYRDSFVYA